MTDAHRVKIQNSNILSRLIAHAEGSVEMKQTEVTAALGLLKKAMPDLSAAELTHDVSDKLGDLMKALDGKTRGIPKRG